MGAPRNLDDVETFLKNMFNDPNIIRVKNRFLRSFISFIITRTRAKSAKDNYKKIGSLSPLLKHTDNLHKIMNESFPDDVIRSIMRYTQPFAKEVLADLKDKNIKEIVLFPLYPHYSTTTVKSSLDDFYQAVSELGFSPKIKTIKPYYKDRDYNLAVIETIKERLSQDPKDINLIFSAHSLPQSIVDSGDPYQEEVEDHVRILRSMLNDEGLEFASYHLAYQSKLGPVKWLEPSLETKLKSLENKKALIVPISFTLDNSETVFELDMEYRNFAKEQGYSFYEVASCPNSSKLLQKSFKGLIDA